LTDNSLDKRTLIENPESMQSNVFMSSGINNIASSKPRNPYKGMNVSPMPNSSHLNDFTNKSSSSSSTYNSNKSSPNNDGMNELTGK
jgi:hypothetical protein